MPVTTPLTTHKCNPRHKRVTARVTAAPPTPVLPIDDVLAHLVSTDPAARKLVTNAIQLFRTSKQAQKIIEQSVTKITRIVVSIAERLSEKDTPAAEQATHDLCLELETVMALGVLTGSGIGFAVGVEYEEKDEDEDEDGPSEDPFI